MNVDWTETPLTTQYLGSAAFSFALLLLMVIVTRITHLTFAKKEQGYTYNNFTFLPYYLMILICLAMMVMVPVFLAPYDAIWSWIFLILMLEIGFLSGGWAIGIQLFEWFLCAELIKFQGT